MEKPPLQPISESLSESLTWSNSLPSPDSNRSSYPKFAPPRLRQPWRHSVSTGGYGLESRTTREFKPDRQRRRLFTVCIWQWFITSLLCGLLAACLGAFGNLLWMTVTQVKAFNALIVLLSLLLGNNLTSSLREYATMMRWRILASKYRPLNEFDLLLRCDSLRKVMRLFWAARTPGGVWFWFNTTQWLCAFWLSLNVLLQVLVALLGLTYNLNTSSFPERRFGNMSIADLTVIRDVWGAKDPEFDAQLGSANFFGIQGQDYLFLEGNPPGQGKVPSFGTPGTPTIYGNPAWSVMTYVFQDQNIQNPQLTLVSHRNISTTATCQQLQVIAGGNGTNAHVTYRDETGEKTTLDVVHVGPGAMTYIGVLNSTCGPRCTEVMALQSANGDTIPQAAFFKCQSRISEVQGIQEYLNNGEPAASYEMPNQQAKIIAGAIGWSGFNYTPDDMYQYVRYNTETWWSPNVPANATMISERIMEFGIEAVAAIDYNGPRRNVLGWYAVPSQKVTVQWRWAASILGLLPFFQLVALIGVISWANSAIIRDDSFLGTARLLRPIVEKLGDNGCLLTGKEIAEELAELRVKYGWREPGPDFAFRNEIDGDVIRHVDILDEREGFGGQGPMPAGRYDGLVPDRQSIEEERVDQLLQRRRKRRSMSL
ncbi:uncharacterized protein Z520_09292 [Fonsecaea multimorphosa CBS 102226]|uniref:Uncharacterized protein n=1 Tax=Fonsecaea multimorphosa CBS 102226 TaxID=1442371 RepID=A0A0D2JNT7_9EURO|nr:uncharacterized protein Z520_09292 [Fonsecaea multimorphosa CBS 102226]KIX94982.1 hypothetical protein Z520_09292 [Fonsecaea multimorphosa CBS 102226]OAL20632.1 hypothetical protein AYO22_08641 [Fonsecaea multimorphosa]